LLTLKLLQLGSKNLNLKSVLACIYNIYNESTWTGYSYIILMKRDEYRAAVNYQKKQVGKRVANQKFLIESIPVHTPTTTPTVTGSDAGAGCNSKVLIIIEHIDRGAQRRKNLRQVWSCRRALQIQHRGTD
jgi:hypothetical protein